MSRRADARLAARMLRALRTGGVLRPVAPGRLRRAMREGRALHATPAATIAINAALDPSGTAIVDERGALTWAELDARARAVAAALAADHGAGPNRPVAIMCRNHGGAMLAIAAAAHTGADALLLNTELPGAQLGRVLGAHPAGVVVHDEEFGERLDLAGRHGDRVLAWRDGAPVSGSLDGLARGDRSIAAPTRRSRIVILTSGTTGVPRAASRDIPARAMAGPLIAMLEHFGLRRGRAAVVGPPIFHGFGLGCAQSAQAIGSAVILQRRFDPEAALAAVERHAATSLIGVPVMLRRILDLDEGVLARYDVSSLLAIVSAGAPLPPTLSNAFMDRFGERLYNAYGTTETGFAAFATPGDLRAAPGTIGRAPVGATMRILDAERRPLPAGQTGRLFVGGDLVFEGYVGGGSKERAGRFMNTGDLGHADAAGRLFVDGREDDMIVSGGENVFPQEVENAVATHPGVADVAVLGVPDEEFGQRLTAFVVPAPGADLSQDEVLAHVRAQLERYKLPREVVFCTEIPRNATGKTLRRRLAPH